MLNLEVRCDASDLDAKMPRVNFEASAAPSRFRDVRIDTLFTAGQG